MNGSGHCGTWNKANQVASQFLEHGQHLLSGWQRSEEPARQAAFQMREKVIEFVLNASLEAGQHRDDQHGKGKHALAQKGVGVEPRVGEKFVGMEIVVDPEKNTMVLRSSWRISLNINLLRRIFMPHDSACRVTQWLS
jgi:hypothetical protein